MFPVHWDTLTEEMLLLLKLESGRGIAPRWRWSSIEETVRQILSVLEKQAQRKNIRIRFQRTQTIPDMHLNATALKLALGNLVENAVKILSGTIRHPGAYRFQPRKRGSS